MGAGLGAVLTAHGATVYTDQTGRSDATINRAKAAGLLQMGIDQLSDLDMVLSVVPPAIAVKTADRVAKSLRGGDGPAPLFVDFNAINPTTAQQVADIAATANIPFLDGGIIGGPPQANRPGPRLYVSGAQTHSALKLRDYGLDVLAMDGGIGAASALKMSYAALTKGLTGLTAAALAAAEKSGVGAALHAEMAHSQAAQLTRAAKALPDMYPKAYRWAPEMREIAGFMGDDLPQGRIWDAIADLYDAIAADVEGPQTDIQHLTTFLARAKTDTPA